MKAQVSGTPFGRYLLGDRIAVGGMGEVYVAVAQGLGGFEKPLALKLLLPHLTTDPRAVEMFLHEAQLTARMGHPNIVQIYDVGVEDERYFIAMELVHGASLMQLMHASHRRQAHLPTALLTQIGRALCEGLHAAHEARGPNGEPLDVVHRDVTPQNVLLSVQGEVKLTDFGIAKARDSHIKTRTGLVVGKFDYLAPEQVLAEGVDRRADVYSAAVTLYYLASFRLPFRRDSDAATLQAIIEGKVPPLRQLRPDLDEQLCAAIHRAMSREREHRFDTARAFAQALPEPGPNATAELAALVRERCPDSVTHLEELTVRVRSLKKHQNRRVSFAAIRRLGLGAALIGLGVAGGVAWTTSSEPEAAKPEPVTEAQSQPLPVPLPVPLPQPSLPVPVPVPVPLPLPEPEPEPRPAPKDRKPGYLSIDATPWAQVFIAGKSIGETPIANYPCEPGVTQVTFKNPQTGKKVTRSVQIKSGQRAFLSAELK